MSIIVKSTTPIESIQDTGGITFLDKCGNVCYYFFDLDYFQETLDGDYDPSISFGELLTLLGFENFSYSTGVQTFPALKIFYFDNTQDNTDTIGKVTLENFCKLIVNRID